VGFKVGATFQAGGRREPHHRGADQDGGEKSPGQGHDVRVHDNEEGREEKEILVARNALAATLTSSAVARSVTTNPHGQQIRVEVAGDLLSMTEPRFASCCVPRHRRPQGL